MKIILPAGRQVTGILSPVPLLFRRPQDKPGCSPVSCRQSASLRRKGKVGIVVPIDKVVPRLVTCFGKIGNLVALVAALDEAVHDEVIHVTRLIVCGKDPAPLSEIMGKDGPRFNGKPVDGNMAGSQSHEFRQDASTLAAVCVGYP